MLLTTILITLFAFANGQKDDPELFMTATEMIRYWGYPAEEHSATTSDGYILGMHRIPSGLSAFVFADAGFDVWMGNARGNTYSKKHVNLTSDDEKFWEFSWDEMQQYDLEAMINYALSVTGQKSLYYIGHSQGTLTMFAKLSLDPAFAPKIKKFFALAPVGSVAHIQGSLHTLADQLTADIELYYELFGSGEFTPNGPVMDLIAQWVCGTSEKGEDRCDNVLFSMMGPEPADQFNKSRTEVYVAHNPAGTSTQNIIHWAQMIEDATVARFDYGSDKKNYQHYGMNTPPLYDFSTIKTDMYLYWSDLDYLADMQDVQEYLIPALNPDYLKLNQFIPGYTHIDFIWGLKATAELYNPIIDIVREDLGGSIQC